MQGPGFRVQGLGFRVQVAGFRVWSTGYMLEGSPAPSKGAADAIDASRRGA